jgi:hypothetical protein
VSVGVTFDSAFHLLRYDLFTFVTFVLFFIIIPPHLIFNISKDPSNLLTKYHQATAVKLLRKFVSVISQILIIRYLFS